MPSNSHLPETSQTYWRWGVPSIVLAVVTLALIALSFLVVEPGVTRRYESIIADTMSLDRLDVSDIRKADLAAQRLMTRFPKDARYRRLHAEVCFKGSLVALQDSAAGSSGGLEDLRESQSASDSLWIRGQESMRSASRLGGDDAERAQAWVIREEFLRSLQSCSDLQNRFGRLESDLQQLGPTTSSEVPFYSLPAISIQRGHQSSPLLDISKRESLIRNGVEGIQTGLMGLEESERFGLVGLIAKSWVVEGQASLDPEQAIESARGAIVQHADQLQSVILGSKLNDRIESVDAFFRCMMLVSGPEEATNSVLSRMDQLPLRDRAMLRQIVAASCLRIWVSKKLYPEGAFRGSSSGGILKAILRIAPEHLELVELLDGYFFDRSISTSVLTNSFDGSTEDRIEDSFWGSLSWMKQEISRGQTQRQESLGVHPEWTARDLEAIVGLLAYWISSAQRNRLVWGQIEPVVDAMVDAYPSSGDIKLGRAILATNLGNLPAAVKDLELIQQSNPGNKMVEQLLQEANGKLAKQESSIPSNQRGPK